MPSKHNPFEDAVLIQKSALGVTLVRLKKNVRQTIDGILLLGIERWFYENYEQLEELAKNYRRTEPGYVNVYTQWMAKRGQGNSYIRYRTSSNDVWFRYTHAVRQGDELILTFVVDKELSTS